MQIEQIKNRKNYTDFLQLNDLYQEYVIEKAKRIEAAKSNTKKTTNSKFSFFDYLKNIFAKKPKKKTVIVTENGKQIEVFDDKFLTKEFEDYVDFIQRREEQLAEFNQMIQDRLSDAGSLKSEQINPEIKTDQMKRAIKRKNMRDLRRKHEGLNKEFAQKKEELLNLDLEVDLS